MHCVGIIMFAILVLKISLPFYLVNVSHFYSTNSIIAGRDYYEIKKMKMREMTKIPFIHVFSTRVYKTAIKTLRLGLEVAPDMIPFNKINRDNF